MQGMGYRNAIGDAARRARCSAQIPLEGSFRLPIEPARLNRLRGSTSDCTAGVGHHSGDEALSLADALHLDGDGVHRVVNPVEPIRELLRKGRHRGSGSLPHASCQRDRQGEKDDDHEQCGEAVHLLGWTVALLPWWRDDGSRHRGCLRHRLVGERQLLVNVGDAFVELRNTQLEAALDGLIGGRVRDLPGKLATLILEVLELIGEFGPLLIECPVDCRRGVCAGPQDDLPRRGWGWLRPAHSHRARRCSWYRLGFPPFGTLPY